MTCEGDGTIESGGEGPRERRALAERAIAALETAGVMISGRKVAAETKRICSDGKGIPRCAFFKDPNLIGLLPSRPRSRRRCNVPAHIREISRLELAQKLIKARELAAALGPSVAMVPWHDQSPGIRKEMEAIEGRTRSSKASVALDRHFARPKFGDEAKENKDQDTGGGMNSAFENAPSGRCQTALATMRDEGLKITPGKLAQRANVHVSTAERFLLRDAAAKHEDPMSWQAVVPCDALLRLAKIELAIALFEERRYVKAQRAVLGAWGTDRRREAMVHYRTRRRAQEEGRARAANSSSVFVTDLTLLGLLPANDDE